MTGYRKLNGLCTGPTPRVFGARKKRIHLMRIPILFVWLLPMFAVSTTAAVSAKSPSASPSVERRWASGDEIGTGHDQHPGSAAMNPADRTICDATRQLLLHTRNFKKAYNSFGASVLPAVLGGAGWSMATSATYRELNRSPCAKVSTRGTFKTCSVISESVAKSKSNAPIVVLSVSVISSVTQGVKKQNIPSIPFYYFKNGPYSPAIKGVSELAAPTPVTISGASLFASWGERQLSFESDETHSKILRSPQLTIEVGRPETDRLILPDIQKICEISLPSSAN